MDDYWEPAKKQLLADAKGFMDSLVKFDKDNIPDRIIKKVRVQRRIVVFLGSIRSKVLEPGFIRSYSRLPASFIRDTGTAQPVGACPEA